MAFAIFLPATFIFVFETTAHCGNTTAGSFSVPVASFQSFSQILAAYSPPKTRPNVLYNEQYLLQRYYRL